MGTSWYDFGNGTTLGSAGSESGITIRDEEFPLGARITLERETRAAPFAITCGIYGNMVHTRFFENETEACAQYDSMRGTLSDILEAASEGGVDRRQVLFDGIAAFVEMYP
jgi:hypothetical protein